SFGYALLRNLAALCFRYQKQGYVGRVINEYTDSFSQENLVGSGMLATLYKAELPNGKDTVLNMDKDFVFEYCENGTLHEALHLNDEIHEKLSWNSRVHMAL
ncbi:leucine-rich repeat protein kinase family protein, partial [Tanacetum coccineum]